MDDLIRRADAIDGLDGHWVERRSLNDWQEGWNAALDWVQGYYLKDLPSVQRDTDEWCKDCSEYDSERHCCPRWNRVIRETLKDAQQWIPCSDRLPEEEVEVFVYLFDRPSPYIAWISKGGKWHTEDFTLEADDNPVTWMPLPEPYKGEQP